jgi:hypothetical protein
MCGVFYGASGTGGKNLLSTKPQAPPAQNVVGADTHQGRCRKLIQAINIQPNAKE